MCTGAYLPGAAYHDQCMCPPNEHATPPNEHATEHVLTSSGARSLVACPSAMGFEVPEIPPPEELSLCPRT